MELDVLVRTWIVEVIRAHTALIAIAIRQRAKFEGWLKFELAAYAELHGAEFVEVETALGDDLARTRSDLTFSYGGKHCHVELKTCNTNWRMEGVLSRTRPITKNVAGIVADARKLKNCSGEGIVAFCMFPVSRDDERWVEYLERISNELGLALSARQKTERVSIQIGSDCRVDVVVIAFAISKDPERLLPPRTVQETIGPGFSEIGTGWPDPTKQEVHLECPPGEPRPGDLIAELIKDTGLPPRADLSRSFGHWAWDYNDIARTVWEEAVPLIERRLAAMYESGIIRAGHCGGYTSEKSFGV